LKRLLAVTLVRQLCEELFFGRFNESSHTYLFEISSPPMPLLPHNRPRIGSVFRRYFSSENTLGSFSPSSWLILLGCGYVPTLGELSTNDRVTLEHEFSHLLLQFTTYAGLLDLRFWGRTLVVLESPCRPEQSAEEHVTEQAQGVLAIARERQVLAIDDFYYLEERPALMQEAQFRQPLSQGWMWGETTGGLFRTDGSLSKRRFWALRFYLDAVDESHSFIRIPVGLRTILEHVATAVDFIGELASRDEPQRKEYLGSLMVQAHTPELLHYFALTHCLSGTLGRLYSIQDRHWTFVVSGQLVSLLADIPFNVASIWEALRKYAQAHRPDIAIHMAHPHPSFVFPLLKDAFARRALPMEQLADPYQVEHTANQVLAQLGLPSLHELLNHRDQLANEVRTLLATHDSSGERVALFNWIAEYERGLSRAEKLLTPAKNLGDLIPVPVLFDDNQYWDGAVLSMAESQRLIGLERRYHDMLRYPTHRDIVDELEESPKD
jgi:hypothetical protein